MDRSGKQVIIGSVAVALVLWLGLTAVIAHFIEKHQPAPSPVFGGFAAPNIVSQPLPEYPAELKARGVEGLVELEASIAKDGTVTKVEVESGPDELKPIAAEAVRHWRYAPFTLGGRTADVQTDTAILFTLGPVDYKSLAATFYRPVAVVSARVPIVPAQHPGANRLGRPAIPDTLEGIIKQTQQVFDAYRENDPKKIDELVNGFAVPDAPAWLKTTFGAEQGEAAEWEYEISFARFQGHMQRVGEVWANAPNAVLHVQESTVPNIPGEAGQPGGPPKLPESLRVENFRFAITTGQVDPGDWVFAFVYVNGAFRIVGGTHTFWNESWGRKTQAIRMWTGNSR